MHGEFGRRYECIRHLGAGAQGSVTLVADRHFGSRAVALKTLLPGEDAAWLGLFKREFEVLARLRHPRLARVFDFGTLKDGRPFFTREYVAGDDLYGRTSGISVSALVAIAAEVCRSLSPLHSSGLVHGDLKPGNIIVDGRDRVRLIDFSFVRASDQGAQLRGTLHYMAPEVIEEKSADVRADLYSLGAVLFEAATGAPLFDGTLREIAAGHLGDSRPEPRPERISVGVDEAPIWRALRSIIARLVARRPEDRFPSVEELSSALAALCPKEDAKPTSWEIPALPPSAGREAETRRVREAVMSRLLGGSSRAALHVVEGEVGSGKSAVLADVKWCAQLAGVTAVEISCSGAGVVAPVIALTEQLADSLADDSKEIALAEALVEELKSLAGGRADLDALALKLGKLAMRASSSAPLLVIADDVDRASDETASLLRGVAASIRSTERAAVLCSCTSGATWKERLGNGESFALPLLDRAAVQRLASTYFGPVAEEKIDRILAHTGGNPLFVGSLLRELATGGGGLDVLERLGPPIELGAYWRARFESLAEESKLVLRALAVLGSSADLREVAATAGLDGDRVSRIAEELDSLGFSHSDGDRLAVFAFLAAEILKASAPEEIASLHGRAADIAVDDSRRLLHAALAGDVSRIRDRWRETALGLERAGALAAAHELLVAVSKALTASGDAHEAELALARVALSRGDHGAAAALLPGLAEKPGRLGMEALTLLGKMHGTRRELGKAIEALERALDRATAPGDTARILAELAQVRFRRGDLEGAEAAARRGLDISPSRDAIRAELYGVLGKAASTRGEHDAAATQCLCAVREARESGDKRALGHASDTLAWARVRAGDLRGAAEELAKALSMHREMGDLRRLMRSELVAGDVDWWLERRAEALAHYEEAMRLGLAVGNPVQGVEVKLGLGQALAGVGRFERASLLLAEAKEDAERLGQKMLRALATAYIGDIAAWRGRSDEALKLWSESRDTLGRLGAQGVCAELELEMAELRVFRGHPGDLEAARALVEAALGRSRDDSGRHFDKELAAIRGCLAIAEGRLEEGMRSLDDLAATLEAEGPSDLLWRVHAAVARALLERGAEMLARQRLRKAERVLEKMADALPPEHRLSFWQDVRRSEVRRLLAVTVTSSTRSLAAGNANDAKNGGLDPEAESLYRVLECNKRLASETDANRLLDTILDAAIELTHAERGFVLLKREGGLEVGAARELGHSESRDPAEQFSRSIAESVCLDGEPVVTVDASGDDRFNEFLSIHALKIKSVACVPVRFRGNTFGVLYLENRLRMGRFAHKDLRVLTAFADQVAISIAHTRLLEETRRKAAELAETTAALEAMCARQAAVIDTGKSDLRLVEERLERARQRLEGGGDYRGLVGTGAAMRRAFDVMERVRDLELPVVILGESGTGKDVAARVLHDSGSRRKGPFVTLPCGGIPETLLESTLFGHGRGAFSGADRDSPGLLAAAAGGTLYVDDIGEMAPRLQVDLLRVLQEGAFVPLGKSEPERVQCRFIASSKEPLEALVARGALRQDLFYRLDVVTVSLPPLRERLEDIPILARAFLHREAARMGRPDPGLAPDALDALSAHDWPGNVRELEQLLRRALIVDDGNGPLSAARLFERQGVPARDGENVAPLVRGSSFNEADEKRRLVAALEACKWNRSLAAQKLGMPRRTFYRRLEKFGLISGADGP